MNKYEKLVAFLDLNLDAFEVPCPCDCDPVAGKDSETDCDAAKSDGVDLSCRDCMRSAYAKYAAVRRARRAAADRIQEFLESAEDDPEDADDSEDPYPPIVLKTIFGATFHNLVVREFGTDAEARAYRQALDDHDGWIESRTAEPDSACPDHDIQCVECPSHHSDNCPLAN